MIEREAEQVLATSLAPSPAAGRLWGCWSGAVVAPAMCGWSSPRLSSSVATRVVSRDSGVVLGTGADVCGACSSLRGGVGRVLLVSSEN